MSFESGSVTFRMFYLAKPFPEGFIDRFRAFALPPTSTLGDTPIRGWVTGRHLQDNNITKDTVYYGGYLRLALCRAERVLPGSLLRSECKIEELARAQAEGRVELDRKTRIEIRKEVEARLFPSAQPQFKAIPIVHACGSAMILAECTSDKQMDALEAAFQETLGIGLIPVSSQYAAARRLNVDIRDLTPTSFSPDCDDETGGNSTGQDFLTWLWFYSEARGGMFKTSSDGDFAVMIEGPLSFVSDGQGAHEAVLRRGTPSISTEAKIALLSGKKLSKARLLVARGQETWQVTVDADQFIFRSLKLPECESLDPISRFQERMTSINTFTTTFLEMFDFFLKERLGDNWEFQLEQIRRWVKDRTARK